MKVRTFQTQKKTIWIYLKMYLYIKRSLFPNNKPIIIPKIIELKAKTIVSGKVSEIIELTVFPLFTNDSLK